MHKYFELSVFICIGKYVALFQADKAIKYFEDELRMDGGRVTEVLPTEPWLEMANADSNAIMVSCEAYDQVFDFLTKGNGLLRNATGMLGKSDII